MALIAGVSVLQQVLSGTILIPFLNGSGLPILEFSCRDCELQRGRGGCAVQATHGHGHGTEMAREGTGRSLQGSVANPGHVQLVFVCPLNHSPSASFWDRPYVRW